MENNHPIQLDEGRVQRGNSGQGPRTPKPEITPKGQASVQQQRACNEEAMASNALRAARRPKPPTLNIIALQMLDIIERDAHYIPEITDTIRKALEALPNDN